MPHLMSPARLHMVHQCQHSTSSLSHAWHGTFKARICLTSSSPSHPAHSQLLDIEERCLIRGACSRRMSGS